MGSKSIGILGVGIMGKILLSSLIKLNWQEKIVVCERNYRRRDMLRKNFPAIKLVRRIPDLEGIKILFLAVKPQDFYKINEVIIDQSILVVSIMAGVAISTIKRKLRVKKVIRAIPNLPAKYGRGFTVWAASREVSNQEKILIRNLWLVLGAEIKVQSEEDVNKATAITGSGPAYILYNIHCFVRAAQEIGFSKKDAQVMVKGVVSGTLSLLTKSETSIETLIKAIASKKGTTQAALKEFNDRDLDKLWLRAVRAALRRGKKLAKG